MTGVDAEVLRRAVVQVEPGSAPGIAEELATPPDGGGGAAPLVYVGARLPDPVPAGLVWFHSVNAGVDALVGAGGWPPGVLLTRTVGRMGERIGQFAAGWVLADCQSVVAHAAQSAAAEWRRIPSELAAGQRALVYGAGRIGAAVGQALQGLGVRTVGVGPREGAAGSAPGFDERVGPRAADGLLGGARWVVAALPQTAGTDGFFGRERFAAMRGAGFVNVGRGGTVDLAALAAGLESGAVRSAVLDVLAEEPPAPGDPVWRLPRTVVTSHSAGITAPEDVVADFTACRRALLAGRTPELAVDPARGY